MRKRYNSIRKGIIENDNDRISNAINSNTTDSHSLNSTLVMVNESASVLSSSSSLEPRACCSGFDRNRTFTLSPLEREQIINYKSNAGYPAAKKTTQQKQSFSNWCKWFEVRAVSKNGVSAVELIRKKK